MRDTLTQLTTRVRVAVHSGKVNAELGTREIASRMALVASGLLTGAGEALRNKVK